MRITLHLTDLFYMKKLTVQLVTWNGAKYIPYLFESLRKQRFLDWELCILDNGSADSTVQAMKKELIDDRLQTTGGGVDVVFTESKENYGFAGGHNMLFKKIVDRRPSSVEYILLLNQDMYLMPDAFANMVQFLETHDDVAVGSPRVMKWNFDRLQATGYRLQDSFTDQIDSLGLKVFRNRRVIEKYTGKKWADVKPKMHLSFRAERFKNEGVALEVFGVSGAFPLFRRSALDYVAFEDGTFLDNSYHAYKEDVDLAFRLRSAGFRAYTLLNTVSYHDRSAQGQEKMGDVVAAKNKKQQLSWVKYHSYKNHLMTLYKNEYWQNWLLDAVFIKWYELKKLVWFLLFDRPVLKGLKEILSLRKTIQQKRKEIISKRKISWMEMRVWWR
ncbi:MAG: hypothetical protein COV60_00375 [Candidatus Magasanikbacteria bacterium CG11_big_fil_rev_8_21_14_0_20_43_7]|uniref:Glycosyltransferase 2-like domain-containing protein n=1 Tax=Candidatus Magasanikbacteria bacterium CG11_big_fil_rev_8_21_14_0_20_43_7 TaxID=1974654 RepID=A0A2H0N3D3_9BACT|nr:MAG: hypothetical protein COV60_00375 [Candidatus Magasanikbacteria bacterium CG11_big_fil_rev_8_21_14_0_20_43_7]